MGTGFFVYHRKGVAMFFGKEKVGKKEVGKKETGKKAMNSQGHEKQSEGVARILLEVGIKDPSILSGSHARQVVNDMHCSNFIEFLKKSGKTLKMSRFQDLQNLEVFGKDGNLICGVQVASK